MKPPRPAAEIKAEIATLSAEVVELVAEIARLEGRLGECRKRLNVVRGSGWSKDGSLLSMLQRELERAELLERDATAMSVVWASPHYGDYGVGWIVEKVTPKRIYVRARGHTRGDMFHHDGTPVAAFGGRIDIEKTFGPGGVR